MMPVPSSRPAAPWEWLLVAVLSVNLIWTTLCLGGYRPETMVVTSSLTALVLAIQFLAPARPRMTTSKTIGRESRRSRAPVSDRRSGADGRENLKIAGQSPALEDEATGRSGVAKVHPAGLLLLPFLIYAAANVLWVTPVPWLGWHDWLGWAQMIAVFWVVLNGVHSRRARTVLFAVVLATALVAVVLACYQRFVRPDWLMLGRTQAGQFIGRASGPFGIPNSLAALLLLLLPATGALAWRRGALRGQRVIYGVAALLLAGGLLLTISRGAWLGLGLASIAWPLLAPGLRWRWRLGGAALATVLLTGALAGTYFGSTAVRDRIDAVLRDAGERTRPIMWRGAWELFREQPVWGTGAGSYNVLFEKYRPEHYGDEPQWAHNDYLNTLSDYGAVGFLLFFGAAGVIAWRCRRGGAPRTSVDAARGFPLEVPVVRQGLAIGLLAFALQLFVDFHFKIPALAMAFAIVAGLLVRETWPKSVASVARVRSRARIGRWVAAAAVAAGTMIFVLPHYRGESARYGTRRQIDALAAAGATPEMTRAVVAQARLVLVRATELDPRNAQAWADRAYAAMLWSHHEPARTHELGEEAEAHARRALALTEAVPEYWIRLGTALNLQKRWVEAGDAFAEALRLAPANAVAWYYQAYHFALNPGTVGLAKSAVATCLRLDPGNREAEALRQHLAARP